MAEFWAARTWKCRAGNFGKSVCSRIKKPLGNHNMHRCSTIHSNQSEGKRFKMKTNKTHKTHLGMITTKRILKGLVLAAGLIFLRHDAVAGQSPVPLGSTSTFRVLAGSTVTSTGATTVNGDLGLSPGTAVTGFPPGIVNGTIHAGDPAAAQAQLDLTVAYNDAAARTLGAITLA